MKITLDRVALAQLIKEDPDFELELKSAVLAEIGRRFFEKDSSKIIAAAQPVMFAQALEAFRDTADVMLLVNQALKDSMVAKPASYYAKLQPTPEVMYIIKTTVEDIKADAIASAISSIGIAYTDQINKWVAERMKVDAIDDRVNKRVERLVNEEIDRRVNVAVKAKIDAINTALAG